MTELKKNSKTIENRNPGVISLHCHSNNKVLLLREKDAFTSRKRPFYSEKAKRALRDSPYGKLSLAKHLDYWRKTIIFA